MGLSDFELLSWSNLLQWQFLLALAVSAGAAVIVATSPRSFWHVLAAGTIIGNLPRVSGYIVADELLLGAVVLGALGVLAVRKSAAVMSARQQVHFALFVVLAAYLVIEAVRGMFITGESRVVRWIALYALLALAAYVAMRPEFRPRSARGLGITVLWSAMVMFGVYMLQGAYFDQITSGHGRFLSQDQFVSGSAYATFPMIIAAPAAIILMRDPSLRVRALAWVTLLLIAGVAFYFDSRVTWLVLAGFVGISLIRIGVRGLAVVAVGLMAIALLYFPDPVKDIPGYIANLGQTAIALYKPSKSDVTRDLQIRAAFNTVTARPDTVVLGYGVNVHKTAIIPYIRSLNREYLPTQDFIIPGSRDDTYTKVFRTTAFGAILIDTGFVGLTMLVAIVFITVWGVGYGPPGSRLLMAAVPMLAMAWLLVSNIQDVVLLYLLILPSGLTTILASIDGEYAQTQLEKSNTPQENAMRDRSVRGPGAFGDIPIPGD